MDLGLPSFMALVIAWTHDNVVEQLIMGIDAYSTDYQVFSREKTTVDGRVTTIIDYEASIAGIPDMHVLQSWTLVGKTLWQVTCGTNPDNYSNCGEDFNDIVRSLRILATDG